MLPLLILFAGCVSADVNIFTDGSGNLAAGWENWSWGTTFDWTSTAIAGRTSLAINSTAYSALSVYAETTFGNSYAGLRFDIAGTAPDVSISLSSTTDNANSESIPVSKLSDAINPNGFTTVTLNFGSLPDGSQLPTDTWNRITFQGGGNGAAYWLDNIMLVSEIVIPPLFLSAEPMLSDMLAVTSQGNVDFSELSVTLNGKSVGATVLTTYVPADTPSKSITYLKLSTPLAPGNLTVSTTSSGSFSSTLPPLLYAALTLGNTSPISPDIYGLNFPNDANYIETLGMTLSRWGGNAVTAYNYEGDFTNAGADWYFENRVSTPGFEDWHAFVKQGGSKSIVTIPALDWVAKDGTSFSYPLTEFPDQASCDPYNPNECNGQFPNGTDVPAPPQGNVYTPWNVTNQIAWMKAMSIKPDIITVDNEIEIASSTHKDMHPIPMDYDEELSRVISTANAAKSVLPNTKVAAPSTCAWWFYWTSVVGYTDNQAHNNQDFLPWFLTQMKTAETTYGKRLLDYLDIHYYYAPDVSGTDAATQALKLRMTRSLWDPSYVDESWIGTSVPAQWNEPNPNAVWLIPRMQALIAQHYPGTKLSISEWSAPDTGVTGALVTADSLGIFGRYGVDAATYWGQPALTDGPALAYWLFRGAGALFGDKSVQVNLSQVVDDTLGVYASSTEAGKVALVVINKDTKPVSLDVANLPTGKYTLKHFGGGAGLAKWVTSVTVSDNQFVTVPSWTAVFLLQQ